MKRLTSVAHEEVLPHLEPGGAAVDATAGNGHDTLFLARHLGPGGRVYAFDLQAQALKQTYRRLQSEKLEQQAILLHRGHETLVRSLPGSLAGRVCAIMFNLGYLPGGDPSFVTRTPATLQALADSLRFLAPSGILSILLYPFHPGGDEESEAVLDWAGNLSPQDFRLSQFRPLPPSSPRLLLIRR